MVSRIDTRQDEAKSAMWKLCRGLGVEEVFSVEGQEAVLHDDHGGLFYLCSVGSGDFLGNER